MNYYLDTNICIYFLKGLYPKISKKLELLHPNHIKIPSIVKAELLFGVKKSKLSKSNMEKVIQFLEPFEIVDFDSDSSIFYSDIRFNLEKKGKVIGPNDLLIASTVISKNGTLVTNNVKEFKNVKGLLIENWTL